jgi:hypothetical protein
MPFGAPRGGQTFESLIGARATTTSRHRRRMIMATAAITDDYH